MEFNLNQTQLSIIDSVNNIMNNMSNMMCDGGNSSPTRGLSAQKKKLNDVSIKVLFDLSTEYLHYYHKSYCALSSYLATYR